MGSHAKMNSTVRDHNGKANNNEFSRYSMVMDGWSRKSINKMKIKKIFFKSKEYIP